MPDLTAALDALETQLVDRQRQLTVLESLMSTRSLGERILPGGWPIVGGWISSHFGYRSDPFTGRGAFHAGVDFAAPPGSQVIATGPGIVSFSGYKNGYGYVVEITHPTGYLTRYGHNSRNLVREGQTVQKGDADRHHRQHRPFDGHARALRGRARRQHAEPDEVPVGAVGAGEGTGIRG